MAEQADKPRVEDLDWLSVPDSAVWQKVILPYLQASRETYIKAFKRAQTPEDLYRTQGAVVVLDEIMEAPTRIPAIVEHAEADEKRRKEADKEREKLEAHGTEHQRKLARYR
jgi:hypothetical protein